GVVAHPATRRQGFQFLDVASSKNDIVGLKRCNQAGHNIKHVVTPLLHAVLFQSTQSDVVLKRSLLVGEMGEFHRLDDSISDKRRSQAGSQTQKKQSTALVASQSLHSGIIYDFHRALEGGLKIKTNPSRSEIMRFYYRLAPENWPRISNRYHVILPIR